MNFQKIVTATLAATILTLSAYAETTTSAPKKKCEFYCGINAGASFNKYKQTGNFVGTAKISAQNSGTNKSPVGEVAEAFIGYGHNFDKINIGIDFGLQLYFGGKMKIINGEFSYSPESLNIMTCKNTFGFSLAPKIGWAITYQLKFFVKAGINATSCKTKYDDSSATGVLAGGVTLLGSGPTNFPTQHTTINKSRMKIAPTLGATINYDFSDVIFGIIEYNYVFNTKTLSSAAASTGWSNTVKLSSQVVKMGVGFRF